MFEKFTLKASPFRVEFQIKIPRTQSFNPPLEHMEKHSLEILTVLCSSEHQSPPPVDLLQYSLEIAKDSREGNLHTC